MRLREAFFSPPATYDFIVFPSETHLAARTLHLLFTCSDHVSVNHAGATLLSEKSNKPQRRERVVAERFPAFYLFAVSIHTSRHHRNCCQQVPRSIRHPILGYRQNTFYSLMAQIDLDASEFSFEQVKEHSKEIQSAILLPPPPISL